MTAIEVIVSLLILIGVFLTLSAAIGIIRLPDVYSRMHAAGKGSTLGVITLMLATFIYFLSKGIAIPKVLLSILFLFMTAPLSALLVNRAAYRNGVPMAKNSVNDDLKKAYEKNAE